SWHGRPARVNLTLVMAEPAMPRSPVCPRLTGRYELLARIWASFSSAIVSRRAIRKSYPLPLQCVRPCVYLGWPHRAVPTILSAGTPYRHFHLHWRAAGVSETLWVNPLHYEIS